MLYGTGFDKKLKAYINHLLNSKIFVDFVTSLKKTDFVRSQIDSDLKISPIQFRDIANSI